MAKEYISPFEMGFDAILSTTHKNFPGPQRAFFCAKNQDAYWQKLYTSIGTYVSNMHPYSIYSLGLMAEHMDLILALSEKMLINACLLSEELEKAGINVVRQIAKDSTEHNTHHIWIKCNTSNEAYDLYRKWESYGFLTNYRFLPYELGYGIRMGLSAASYCGLNPSDIPILSELMAKVAFSQSYNSLLHQECKELIHKIKNIR